ncbi:MAG: PGPGW domain-containing protein [Thermodesulfobacteriota bacterium]
MDLFSDYSWILQILGGVSLATFLISLLIIPFLLTRASKEYFLVHIGHHEEEECDRGAICPVLSVIRNILGGILLAAGIAMLFLPGQGILTILLALTLLDLPGKEKLLAWAISKPSIQHGLNWIREKAHKEPFLFPEHNG